MSFALACAGTPAKRTRDKDSEVGSPDNGGWTSLFNGRDLSGWTPKIKGFPLGQNFGETFRVVDGNLTVAYDQYEQFEGRFGHLFCNSEFASYELELEYRFLSEQTPGGPGWALRNSGVMIHGQTAQSMGLNQDFPVSIEVQLLGGVNEGERPTGNLCTPGTNVVMNDELLLRHCVDSNSKTYRDDQWVALRIEVLGHDSIRHFINEQLVLEYRRPQLDQRDEFAQQLLLERAGQKSLSAGSISLQAESHPCQFRNIRIREL